MKIIARMLSLEVTEDCNLVCSHCLCGERRKVTMSDEVIRGVFSKVSIVDELFLTGGEVFLAYDTIKRVLEIAKEMDVDILNCSLVTNGCVYDERIYKLLDEYFQDNYAVFISNDVYHDNSMKRIYNKREMSLNPELDPKSMEDVINNTMRHMKNKHFNSFKFLGNKLINVGRAKNLPGEKYQFEVMGYFYDYFKENVIMVGPVIFVSADGYITEGNDEIKHYEEGSLGNVLDKDWELAIINGGIHIPCGSTFKFWNYLERREDEYQNLSGKHYIIEDKRMKEINIEKRHKTEEEMARFMNYLTNECQDGITSEKILAYNFSEYPYDVSIMEHME